MRGRRFYEVARPDSFKGQFLLNRVRKKFKKQIPDITFSTDIIVGFPGETDKDFNETLDIINEIKPEILNRSNFGKRLGTPAEKMESISPDEMKKRATELMNLHLKICNENQKQWGGGLDSDVW